MRIGFDSCWLVIGNNLFLLLELLVIIVGLDNCWFGLLVLNIWFLSSRPQGARRPMPRRPPGP